MSYTMLDSLCDYQDMHEPEELRLTIDQINLVLRWLNMPENPRAYRVETFVEGSLRTRE